MSEDDSVDLGPTHALLSIPELERDQWCIDVVKSLADAAEKVMKMKAKIPQAKAAKSFIAELRAKRDEILPVFFYIVKPQFRETMQELLEKFAGVDETVGEGKK